MDDRFIEYAHKDMHGVLVGNRIKAICKMLKSVLNL